MLLTSLSGKQKIRQEFLAHHHSSVIELVERFGGEVFCDEDLLFYYLVSLNELFVKTNDNTFLDKAKKLITTVPLITDAGLLRLASLTYLHSEDTIKAIEYAESAHKNDKSPTTLIALGNAYRANMDFAQAISAYEKAIHNESITSEINLFELYKQLDKKDRAQEIAQHILEKVEFVPHAEIYDDFIQRIRVFLDASDIEEVLRNER